MNNIITSANNLVKKHKTNDPFVLCDILNINLTITKLPKSINGFYTNIMDMPFIFLSEQLDDCLKKAICAHELGHYILHPNINTLFVKQSTLFSSAKLEREADLFAASLLIPDKVFLFDASETITADQLAYELDVPTELIKIKFACKGA